MRLRQVNSPADKAVWTEHFYNGELKVVNSEVETDNPDWIKELIFRGYRNVEDVPRDVKVFGEVRTEETVEPLGTQVAAATESESEREHVEELIDEVAENKAEEEAEAEEAHEEIAEPSEEDKPFGEEDDFDFSDDDIASMFEENPLEGMFNRADGKTSGGRRQRKPNYDLEGVL